mmetsp:Transcript_16769/g.41302  ORF Transcript_16769/g.41302 Transcript_16769/m.41302 type:complete len:238 (-) Transcript_16769:632-1345(-)
MPVHPEMSSRLSLGHPPDLPLSSDASPAAVMPGVHPAMERDSSAAAAGCAASAATPLSVSRVHRARLKPVSPWKTSRRPGASASLTAASHPSRSIHAMRPPAGPCAAARSTRSTSSEEAILGAHLRSDREVSAGYAAAREANPARLRVGGRTRSRLVARQPRTVSARSLHTRAARAASRAPNLSSMSSRSSGGSASHRFGPVSESGARSAPRPGANLGPLGDARGASPAVGDREEVR